MPRRLTSLEIELDRRGTLTSPMSCRWSGSTSAMIDLDLKRAPLSRIRPLPNAAMHVDPQHRLLGRPVQTNVPSSGQAAEENVKVSV